MLPVSYLAMNILIKQIKEIHMKTEILQRGDNVNTVDSIGYSW